MAEGLTGPPRPPTVFLVDDEETNLLLLKKALSGSSYKLEEFHNGQEVLDALSSGLMPDLVLLDVMMPVMDGFTLCELMKKNPATRHGPIVLVTGLEDLADKIRGLEAGADDFLTKPFYPAELRARVRSLLRIKTLYDDLQEKNRSLRDEKLHLEELVQERTEELEDMTVGVVVALEMVNTLRDTDTGLHIKRVCLYSFALARELDLDPVLAGQIKRCASLHDVGKAGVPDAILKKRGALTPEEREQMKQHTLFGYELLGLAQAHTIARNIALSHHEKYDGTGYPYGLKGEDIPLEARIVALADVYDALTTRRCYKEAYPPDKAKEIILGETGRHFDPVVVDAYQAAMEEFDHIREGYKETL